MNITSHQTIFAATLWTLAVVGVACNSSSSSSGGASAYATPTSCTQDGDCAGGQGCNRDEDSIVTGYCAPLCVEDEQCPTKIECPGNRPSEDRDCREAGRHRGGNGVCELYDGAKTPQACATTDEGCADIVSCSDAYSIRRVSGEACDACLRAKCANEIIGCGQGGSNCAKSSDCFAVPFLADHTGPDICPEPVACYVGRQACQDVRATEPAAVPFFKCFMNACRSACAPESCAWQDGPPACSVLAK